MSAALPLRPAGLPRGTKGAIEVRPELWRMTWDNRRVEDLSAYVVSGRVSCDPERDATWRLDCTLRSEGWERLRPYRDWVAVFPVYEMPDGEIRTAQLGLYLVLDSAEDREEGGYTVRLDARDPLWLLARQTFATKVTAKAGWDKGDFARDVVANSVLTEDRVGRPRYAIPALGKDFAEAFEWEERASRLEVANEALTGGNAYPLWCGRTGIITTRSRSSRLRDRSPVRVWHAFVPPTNRATPPVQDAIVAVKHAPSEVVGTVPTVPGSGDLVNEVVVVNDRGGNTRIFERHRIGNPSNRRSVMATGSDERLFSGRPVTNPLIEDAATAKEVAAALADELGTKNTTMTLRVLPDPAADLIREVVMLGIWDAAGAPVARGRWWVRAVRYGLTAEDPLMELDLGKVEDPDEFA